MGEVVHLLASPCQSAQGLAAGVLRNLSGDESRVVQRACARAAPLLPCCSCSAAAALIRKHKSWQL